MRRYGLWRDAQAVHRSSVSKARHKISWEFFKDLFEDAVLLACNTLPVTADMLWLGMSVYAIDGSQFILPATQNIRETFDPDSGLSTNGKGHFPYCLVSTLYDVFRRIPVARTIVDSKGSEREEAAHLLKQLPTKRNLILFDRGYPSFELIHLLTSMKNTAFIFRCYTTSTFNVITDFVNKGLEQGELFIDPTDNFLAKIPYENRKQIKPIKLRVIRMVSPSDGTVSVLLTNLYNQSTYSFQDITDLYFKRWEIEVYYRDEKTVLDATRFHSKTVNGVLQEMYAIAIMSVLARTMMHLSSEFILHGKHMPQFKNAIIALSCDVGQIVSDDPETAAWIFKELLQEISRVVYHRPSMKREPQPRVNKGPNNKWKYRKRSKS